MFDEITATKARELVVENSFRKIQREEIENEKLDARLNIKAKQLVEYFEGKILKACSNCKSSVTIDWLPWYAWFYDYVGKHNDYFKPEADELLGEFNSKLLRKAFDILHKKGFITSFSRDNAGYVNYSIINIHWPKLETKDQK